MAMRINVSNFFLFSSSNWSSLRSVALIYSLDSSPSLSMRGLAWLSVSAASLSASCLVFSTTCWIISLTNNLSSALSRFSLRNELSRSPLYPLTLPL
jgi:hypothetical protein